VGKRLELAAEKIAYGENIDYSGPTYSSMRVKGNKAILTFDNADGGLVSHGGALKGFAICGPDHKFVWAVAEIDGKNEVVVSSPAVEKPVAVRYGWADYPVVNLWNEAGLPASPFRTDNF
jgi:sialate O-acetylesterase